MRSRDCLVGTVSSVGVGLLVVVIDDMVVTVVIVYILYLLPHAYSSKRRGGFPFVVGRSCAKDSEA